MNKFTFNGISSEDFGLYVSKKNIFSTPARKGKLISVPGRNGDIIEDDESFENVPISYTVGLKNITSVISDVNGWLCKDGGYFRLSDTYQPGYFRMACHRSATNVNEMLQNVGTAQILFSCKPFRYSEIGQQATTFTSSGYIENPEEFESEPLIRIYGSGNVTLQINGDAFLVKNISSYIDIDSELMACYYGNTLKNSSIGFASFPILQSGSNRIAWSGGTVSKVEVTPRWRTI